jgi:tetratricopeptide (TPR) repeat protein
MPAILDQIQSAVDAHDYKRALALIAQAVGDDVLDPKLLLLRAQSYEHLGDRTRAAVDYANLANLLGGAPDALVPVAIQLAHLGRHADELALYDRILAADPEHFDGLYLKALRLVKMGRHRECLACIDRALLVRPDDGNSHYTKACAHALLGEADAAIASVQRALAVAPELRFSIATDEDFDSIASDPRFVAAVN